MAVNAHHSGTKGLLQQRLRSALHQMVSRGDSLKFSLAKESAELERGYPYAQTRQMQTRYVNLPERTVITDLAVLMEYIQLHPPQPLHRINGACPLYIRMFGIVFYNPSALLTIAVYKRMPFYNILTYVTQSYHVPGIN